MSPTALRITRFVFLAFLALYGIASLRDPGAGRIMDSVDLAIHETGHLVFAPFGEFMGFAGGTLFQILFPAVFVGYFVKKKQRFAAAVCLWWVAQNFWNVSVYVADARTLALPLVGGGEHDWNYLLGELGSLRQDQGVARAFHATGVLIFLVALALGFLAARSAPDATNVEPASDSVVPISK